MAQSALHFVENSIRAVGRTVINGFVMDLKVEISILVAWGVHGINRSPKKPKKHKRKYTCSRAEGQLEWWSVEAPSYRPWGCARHRKRIQHIRPACRPIPRRRAPACGPKAGRTSWHRSSWVSDRPAAAEWRWRRPRCSRGSASRLSGCPSSPMCSRWCTNHSAAEAVLCTIQLDLSLMSTCHRCSLEFRLINVKLRLIWHSTKIHRDWFIHLKSQQWLNNYVGSVLLFSTEFLDLLEAEDADASILCHSHRSGRDGFDIDQLFEARWRII